MIQSDIFEVYQSYYFLFIFWRGKRTGAKRSSA